MKYRIIIVIIIIISLGEILLSYIANTSHVGAPKHDEVNDPHYWTVAGSLKKIHALRPDFPDVLPVFRVYKIARPN